MPEGVLPVLMFAWRQVELEVFRRQSRSFPFFLSPGFFIFSVQVFSFFSVQVFSFFPQSRSLFYSSLSPRLFCKASPSLCDQNLMCRSVTRPKKYAVTEIFTQTKNFAMNNDHFPNRNPSDTGIFFWGLSLRCQCKHLPRLKWSQPLRFLFLHTFIQLWWGRAILPALILNDDDYGQKEKCFFLQRWPYLRGRGSLWLALQGLTILPLLFHDLSKQNL